MAATLFVVGTPLGNLSDLSSRAAACLRDVSVVYAEDTRRSAVLLNHLGLRKTLRSLHAHNELSRAGEVLAALQEGADVALLSDAGTPAVSDPGADVVAAAHRAGFRVSPIAGPSALTAAMSVAGFSGTDVLFLGFLPARGKDKRTALTRLAAHSGCAVLFEAPHRLADTLQALAAATPDRLVCICRELTKMHEEVVRQGAAAAAAWAADRTILGEITLVCGPNPQPEVTAAQQDIDHAIGRCRKAGLSARDTASAVAAILETSRRAVYARCQELG